MTVRPIEAWETDTVEIRWRLADGTEFCESVTIPPKDVREARRQAYEADQAQKRSRLMNASGQVVERSGENAAGQKL